MCSQPRNKRKIELSLQQAEGQDGGKQGSKDRVLLGGQELV